MNIKENEAIRNAIKEIEPENLSEVKAYLLAKCKTVSWLFWLLVIFLVITLIIYGVCLNPSSLNTIAAVNCLLAIQIVTPIIIFIIWIVNITMIYQVGFFKECDKSFNEIKTILFLGAFFIVPTIIGASYIKRAIYRWNKVFTDLEKEND